MYANRYYWLWGDVDTSSSTKGNHVFESAGTFRIIHVARIDTLGCTSEDTISKEITVLEKIKAGIKVGSSGKCVPYTLNVSPVNATGARLIEWFFNDNGNIIRKTGQAASHPFKVPGSYSVKLVIHTANACTDTATYNFKVYDIPTLNFDPLHTATCSHDTSVTFLANPSYSGTDALRYEWFIKDQLKGTSNPFVYPFRTSQVSDTFTIKALALNSEGCGDTSKAGTIIILPVPEINIKFSPQSPIFEPDYTFTFSNTRPGNQNYIHRWSMGDRSLQTRDGTEITYTYGGTGTYKVKLNVTDFTNGCSNKDSVNVTILPVPGYLYVPNAMCLKCSNASLRRFLPLGKGLSTYHLRIFSPWGQLVFETKELNPDGSPIVAWNGTWLNSQNEKSVLEQDVFRWEIRATYKNGTEWKGMLYPQTGYIKTGFITLIK